MVWLPWGSSEKKDGPPKTADGAFEAPNRTNRAKCYAARDAFFDCLDANNILDSIGDKQSVLAANKACGKLNEEFEKNCAHSWVEYFKKQRIVNFQKEQTIKKIEAEGGEIFAPGAPTKR
ncbi:hypothetical protein GQ43DRAFT_440188 [Delitschia confertaspora ATCC 74209]|uniref:Cytochrome oxidase c subunit VIb n=1 Tax=Delitschia confertaspora ATCC 74209 TaxID=1513339 RepID=A0A9P4MW85_9PLEO|nr:hypothetical protein GQ43DRAFT_440188 [Delitschia confertaspora ATCC 74209]